MSPGFPHPPVLFPTPGHASTSSPFPFPLLHQGQAFSSYLQGTAPPSLPPSCPFYTSFGTSHALNPTYLGFWNLGDTLLYHKAYILETLSRNNVSLLGYCDL